MDSAAFKLDCPAKAIKSAVSMAANWLPLSALTCSSVRLATCSVVSDLICAPVSFLSELGATAAKSAVSSLEICAVVRAEI